MPIKTYAKGRRKEMKLKKELERGGCVVLRMAGSHGFADLVAIDEKKNIIIFYQCKPDNFSKNKAQELLDEHVVYNIGRNWKTAFVVI